MCLFKDICCITHTCAFVVLSHENYMSNHNTQHQNHEERHTRSGHPTGHHLSDTSPNRVSGTCPISTNTRHLIPVIFSTETFPICKHIVWISLRTRVADTADFLSTIGSSYSCIETHDVQQVSHQVSRQRNVRYSWVSITYDDDELFSMMRDVVSYLGHTVSLQEQSSR